MKSCKLIIPPVGYQKDLSIIYKEGEKEIQEIRTSKDEFLKSLRFFKNKSNEIESKEIYIVT